MARILHNICFLGLFAGLLCVGCSRYEEPAANSTRNSVDLDEYSAKLAIRLDRIKPFFKKMAEPATSDWLASHNEPGQLFEEYLEAKPKVPAPRSKIYILPLGSFSRAERDIVNAAAGFIGEFYGLPVSQMSERPLTADANNSRFSPADRRRQIRTGFILKDILVPALPKDAAALLAFTKQDLYGSEATNYVFGQADIDSKVGVWSLSRLRENAGPNVFLERTLKIAVHETGHLFSIRHCTAYECVMSGTNHLAETDRRPLDACPEDTAKICWFSHTDPAARYRKLAAYTAKLGLSGEAEQYRRKAEAVEK